MDGCANLEIVNVLKNISGHKEELKEILFILNCLENYEFWKSKGVTIPSGILIYGSPGMVKV